MTSPACSPACRRFPLSNRYQSRPRKTLRRSRRQPRLRPSRRNPRLYRSSTGADPARSQVRSQPLGNRCPHLPKNDRTQISRRVLGKARSRGRSRTQALMKLSSSPETPNVPTPEASTPPSLANRPTPSISEKNSLLRSSITSPKSTSTTSSAISSISSPSAASLHSAPLLLPISARTLCNPKRRSRSGPFPRLYRPENPQAATRQPLQATRLYQLFDRVHQ
jgi:hypothetical protein